MILFGFTMLEDAADKRREALAEWITKHNEQVRKEREERTAEKVTAYNEGLREGKRMARESDAPRRDKAKLVLLDEVSAIIDDLSTHAPGYPTELEPGSIEFTAWKLATMNRIAHLLHKI